MAGYSGKPLVEKLGIKPGYSILLVNQPPDYATVLGALPDDVHIIQEEPGQTVDFVQLFVTTEAELRLQFPPLKQKITPSGALWISWPKGRSGLATDLNENRIREIGLENGLVDVKVCAVDEQWSGLKFVYRLKDRA